MEPGRGRRTKRMAIHWPTMLLAGVERQACTIVDVSRGGAKIRLTHPLAPRSRITLVDDRIGALEAVVAWCRGDVAGVAFLPDTAHDALVKLRQVINALEEAEARRAGALRPRPQFGRRTHHGTARK